jgi:hypothetical protein
MSTRGSGWGLPDWDCNSRLEVSISSKDGSRISAGVDDHASACRGNLAHAGSLWSWRRNRDTDRVDNSDKWKPSGRLGAGSFGELLLVR